MSLHIHTYHEIIACIDKNVKMLTRDGDIVLEKGDLAIIPPDYQHTIIYTDNDSVVRSYTYCGTGSKLSCFTCNASSVSKTLPISFANST
jgi:hypothetical protein